MKYHDALADTVVAGIITFMLLAMVSALVDVPAVVLAIAPLAVAGIVAVLTFHDPSGWPSAGMHDYMEGSGLPPTGGEQDALVWAKYTDGVQGVLDQATAHVRALTGDDTLTVVIDDRPVTE